MPVTLPTTPLASQADLDALAARVSKLESGTTPPGPTPGTPSPTGHYITKPADPPIIDDAMNAWGLVAGTAASGQQIAVQKAGTTAPVVDPITAHVSKLGIDLVAGKRQIVQQNAAGSFYTASGPGQAWQQITGPDGPVVPPTPGSTYRVSGGHILKPDGTRFKARGLNLFFLNWPENTQIEAGRAVADAAANPLSATFPGTNFVRFVCFQSVGQCAMATADAIAPYVDHLTANGIVVMLDPHIFPGLLSGNDLATVCSRMAEYATRWKGNPNVWGETQNEPAGNTDAEVTAIYNAWRNTGNTNPMVIYVDGENWGGALSPAVVAGMHNVIFEIHYYGHNSGYSTDQAAVSANLAGLVAGRSHYTSADGPVPVMCCEFGAAGFVGAPSDGGYDANGSWQTKNWAQAKQAVYNSPDLEGWAEWAWNVPDMFYPYANNICALLNTSYDGSLSLNGQHLRDAIAAAAAASA